MAMNIFSTYTEGIQTAQAVEPTRCTIFQVTEGEKISMIIIVWKKEGGVSSTEPVP